MPCSRAEREKIKRCVADIRANPKSKVDDPWAVCTARITGRSLAKCVVRIERRAVYGGLRKGR